MKFFKYGFLFALLFTTEFVIAAPNDKNNNESGIRKHNNSEHNVGVSHNKKTIKAQQEKIKKIRRLAAIRRIRQRRANEKSKSQYYDVYNNYSNFFEDHSQDRSGMILGFSLNAGAINNGSSALSNPELGHGFYVSLYHLWQSFGGILNFNYLSSKGNSDGSVGGYFGASIGPYVQASNYIGLYTKIGYGWSDGKGGASLGLGFTFKPLYSSKQPFLINVGYDKLIGDSRYVNTNQFNIGIGTSF